MTSAASKFTSVRALFLACLSIAAWEGRAHADDVTVRGRAREAGATTLTRDELREMPGAFGDPGRVLEALPGVIPVATALPFYYVRGATPSNTAYFLDGMRVPLFSHTPPGGGIVASSLVDRVELFPGAAPARFGGMTGGVLSVTTRAPSTRPHAEVGLRLYDSSALVETPLYDGRASVLASARYGYSQWLLDVFSPTDRQSYWDYYARANVDGSSVVVLGAHDFVGREDETIVESTFHRVELRHDIATRGGGAVRVAGTVGVNTQGNDVGAVNDRVLAVRAESTQPLSRDVRLGLGASTTNDRYDVTVNRGVAPTNPQVLFAPRTDLTNALYGELAMRVAPAVQVDAGMRLGMFSTKRDEYPALYGLGGRRDVPLPPAGAAAQVAVDPRLAVKVRMHPRVSLVSAFGLAHGPPSFFLPGLAMSRLEDGLLTATQTSTGFELALPADFTAKVTGFLHDYLNLNDPASTCADQTAIIFNPIDPCFARRVRGRTFGGELLVRRSVTQRLSGWLAYTLARSTREAHAPGWTIIGRSNDALVDGLSEWDRTHVVTAMTTYDFGRGWRGSARFSYQTGRPFTRTVNGVQVPPYNADRLPDVHRVDLRLEKKWSLGEERAVSFIAEVFNLTAQNEVSDCRPATTVQNAPVPELVVRGRPVDACQFARYPAFFLPSVGVEGTF